MKKRLSIMLVGTAVTVLAAVGVFAGVIAAQSNDDDGGRHSFVERVASILGIDSESVESAFKQAKEELHTERVDAKFAGLVESGTLTQEEADAIKAWQESKPEIEFNFGGKDSDGDGKRGWGGKGFGKGGGMLFGSEEKLDYLVEQGVITQADADSLTAWWDSRPEALDGLMGDRDRDGKRGRGKHGKGDWKWDKDGEGASASKDDVDA